MLISRVLYGAVAGGALLLTLPGTLRQEPTNPASGVKSPILLRAEEMNWEACTAALPRGPKCATVEGDRTAANVPFTYRLKLPDG